MPRRTAPAQAGIARTNLRRVQAFREDRGRASRPAEGTHPGTDTGNVGGRPPLLLDYRRGWVIIETICQTIMMAGSDALAARAAGIHPHTLIEWKQIGDIEFESLSENDRETLERTALMFVGGRGEDKLAIRHIDELIVSRYAKFAACYRQAEATCIMNGLALLQAHAQKDWRVILATFNRRFPKEYGEPESGMSIGVSASMNGGPGGQSMRVQVAMYELPRNGFEPDSTRAVSEIEEDEADDAYWETLNKKRDRSAAKRRPAGKPVAVIPAPAVTVTPPTAPDQPDTLNRLTRIPRRVKLPPSSL